jgi:hypothetical protein
MCVQGVLPAKMNKYQGQTDQTTKVELPSSIQQVLWTKRMAAAGGKVGLDIYTHFVGNGSDLKIELSEHSGNKLGSFKEKICGNHFWAQITIPQDAKEALYAKAKLPKHGLEMKSNPLVILPPIEISNLKWDKEEARRGDILKLTADIKGVFDGAEAEIEIWEHDADEAHDLITRFPALVKNAKIEAEWEFEYYDDTDDISTEEESEKGYNPPEYFFRVKVGEIYDDSGLLGFKDWIGIELVDEDGEPVPDEEYILVLPDGQEKKGQLDSKGLAKEENLPPGRIKVEFPNIDH